MSNRRPQAAKTVKTKKTDPYRPEKRIRSAGTPRNPKHRNKGWNND